MHQQYIGPLTVNQDIEADVSDVDRSSLYTHMVPLSMNRLSIYIFASLHSQYLAGNTI